jgi:arylsulfatase
VPFPFTGKLNKLTIALDRPQLTEADIAKLKEAMQKAAE